MSVAEVDVAGSLLAQPHHDGSEAHVVQRPDDLGDEAVVLLRVPRAAGVEAVGLRYVRDGEPRRVRAEVDRESERETWWRASFPAANPATRYRWFVKGDGGEAWVNGLGVVRHDVPDADDFVMSVDPGGPPWHLESVVYQVFPDRFATSGLDVEPPAWAIPRAWDDLPTGRGPETPYEWFGGDLRGVEEHLDHIERLGASVLYMTPIFPAGSTHRYDATTFDHVDPLLGGDEAFASLVAAAHARGIRVVGDLTTNHTGDMHQWFAAARAGGAEREFYFFDDDGGYESWLGISTLPKLDWRSAELRERMSATVRHWLDAGLDGWRIDVANMTGRFGAVDTNHDAARAVRQAVGDALLLAEHNYDFRPDAASWHDTMNYPGFTRPVWGWLRGDRELYGELAFAVAARDAGEMVASMRAFRAGMPWSSVIHSWVLLDSHDAPRFRTVTGARDRQLVGVGLQMTTPGVPMIFAGDEIGLEGEWGEDARRTMPWSRPETWDATLFDEYRRLIALRRSSPALARGGIRYAHVDADAVAYLRETTEERLLCVASRSERAPLRLPLESLDATELEPLTGGEATFENGTAGLAADGPSFHVWRLTDG